MLKFIHVLSFTCTYFGAVKFIVCAQDKSVYGVCCSFITRVHYRQNNQLQRVTAKVLKYQIPSLCENMNAVERRLSVQEKIEELERNKITLHPPVFDSKLNMSAEKKTPETEANSSDAQSNTIRVIKSNEAEHLNVELNLGGKTTDVTMKDAVIKEISDQKNDFHGGEKKDTENEKDTDTEKETVKKMEKVEGSKAKLNTPNEELAAQKTLPLVPMTDAEIDQIVAKYPTLQKDEKKLKEYLDFFFDMDSPRYGYFTFRMLIWKLNKDGCSVSDEEAARMFCDLDANNDLLVSLDEYLSEMSKPARKTLSKEELKDWFQRFDADKDGFLSQNDIEISLAQMTGKTPYSILVYEMLSWDKSGNYEKLNFEEFCLSYKKPTRTLDYYSNPPDDLFTDLISPYTNKLSLRF